MGPMASDAVKEELNSVLTLLREKEKVRLDIRSTPETYIDKRSNPKEVQAWLKSKDFNEAICSKFKGVTGYQLLAMSKQDLEKVCGEKTGARLHSFLLVQKSVSGVSSANDLPYVWKMLPISNLIDYIIQLLEINLKY